MRPGKLRAGLKTAREVLEETFDGWSDHRATTQAAALAFYTLASLAPLLMVVISVAGGVFGADAVRGEVERDLASLMGVEQARMIQEVLKHVAFSGVTSLAGILGLGILLFTASGVFIQLQEALNTVWEVAPRPGSPFRLLLRKRLICFALLFGIGLLLLLSLTLSTTMAAFGRLLVLQHPVVFRVVEVGNAAVAFSFSTLFFALIYRVLPDAEIPWRDVLLSAVVTASLFSAGRWLIALYLAHTSVASPYGAAGSLVALLFWVYLSTLILLFGAELARATARRLHHHQVAPSPGAVEAPAAPRPQRGAAHGEAQTA